MLFIYIYIIIIISIIIITIFFLLFWRTLLGCVEPNGNQPRVPNPICKAPCGLSLGRGLRAHTHTRTFALQQSSIGPTFLASRCFPLSPTCMSYYDFHFFSAMSTRNLVSIKPK